MIIDETYSRLLESYELPERFIKVTVNFYSESTEHKEISASASMDGLVLADDLDSLMFLLTESSNDTFNEVAKDIDLFIEDMRRSATSSWRQEEELAERKAELKELENEYWASR